MKLKCDDGKVRRFRVSRYSDVFNRWSEGSCVECGTLFGVHDTKILNPKFKKHICEVNTNGKRT